MADSPNVLRGVGGSTEERRRRRRRRRFSENGRIPAADIANSGVIRSIGGGRRRRREGFHHDLSPLVDSHK